MAIDIVSFRDDDIKSWDSFVNVSVNGTLFHRLDFLSYPEKKFSPCHFAAKKGRETLAVIPGALLHDENGVSFRSPYSASYGGFVFKKVPPFELASEIVESFVQEMKKRRVQRILITSAPSLYSNFSMDVLEFCMEQSGFHCMNADMTSAMRVDCFKSADDIMLSFGENARRNVKKGKEYSVDITESNDLQMFYELIMENAQRVNYHPAHSLKELEKLCQCIPQNLKLFLARYNGESAGGILLFLCTPRVALAFYICVREEMKKAQPAALLYYHVLNWARENKFSWVDFGTSTLKMEPNFGLARFKEGFGAVHFFRKTYEKEFCE